MLCFRRVVVFGLGVICVTTAAAQQATVQSQGDRTVSFRVVVTDEAGRCVTNLKQSDFTLFENDSVQPIASFRGIVLKPKGESPRLVPFVDTKTKTGCYAGGGLLQYELSFHVPEVARPNEYRRVAVKIDRAKLDIGSIRGYYVKP